MVNTKIQPGIAMIIFVICLWGILIYANALNSRFQFDDYPVIVHNPVIQTGPLTSLWQTVPHPTRLVAYLSFALNYRINGLNPVGYHLVNILIHLVNALLVFQLVRLLFQTPFLKDRRDEHIIGSAAVCASLFLCHPIQTESVTYITQRFTSLAVLFYLASLCFYLSGRLNVLLNKNRALVLFCASGLCAAAGMLTKQITLTLPVMILLTEFLFFERKSRKAWGGVIVPAVFLLLVIPALYAFDAGGILSITHQSGSHEGDVITSQSYALTQPRVIMTYLKLLFVPVNQNLLYDFPMTRSLFEWKTLLSCLFILFLVIAGIRLYRVNRLYTFGIFWFFITLLVESTVIPIRHVIFEHRLYLPSVGFFLVITVLLEQLFQNKRVFYLAAVSLLVLLSVLTVKRNLVWQDGVTLWQDVVKKSPRQARPYYNLGYEHLKKREPELALMNFSKALDIKPDYFDAYNNRSQVYFDLGRLDKAFEDINRAIKIDGQRAEAYLNRGMIIRQMGQYEPAIKDFSRAIELEPANYVYYLNRGVTYGNITQFELALKDLNKSLEINPRYAKAYNARGAVNLALSRREDALDDFNQAIRYDPADLAAYRNRSQLFQDNTQYDLALNDLNKIIELDPADLDVYLRRAFVLAKLDRLEDALKDLSTIAARDPALPQISMEKGKIYYRRQQYRQAADEFDHALKQSPNDASAYLLRGLCHYELKQYQHALTDINKAKELGQPVDEHYLIQIKKAMGQS